jgi:hypothetical protein
MTYRDNGYVPRVGYSQQFREVAPAGVRPDVLLHHWGFEGDYTDSVGSLTLSPQIGTPTFVTGLNGGQAVRLTASDYYLQSASTTVALLDGGASFSASGWFKQASANQILTLLHPSGGTQGTWLLKNHQPSLNWAAAEVWDQSMAARWRATDSLVTDTGVWVFMALTWNQSTETLNMYIGINGAALNSFAGTEAGSYTTRWTGTTQFRSCTAAPAGNIDLDDFRIWNIELTAAEVAEEYAEGGL